MLMYRLKGFPLTFGVFAEAMNSSHALWSFSVNLWTSTAYFSQPRCKVNSQPILLIADP